MRCLLPVAALAGMLVACQPATRSDDSEAAASEAAPQGAPATGGSVSASIPADTTVYPDGEPRWTVSQDGENGYLSYAVPETDDVRFLLHCGPGERFVRLWRTTWEGDEPSFQLASGTVTTSYPGEVNPEGMEPQLDGVAPARAPVFVAFRETGQLTLTVGGEVHDISAPAGALPLVASFFDYCGPPGS